MIFLYRNMSNRLAFPSAGGAAVKGWALAALKASSEFARHLVDRPVD
jgi:hypothetical protein